MRKQMIFIGCDKTYAETGEYVVADETHILSLDGDAVELDLTAARAAELLEWVRPWIRAGHKPGSGPELPEQPKPGRGHRRELPGTRTFYAGVREYAKDQGIEIPLSGRKQGTRTKAKRTYDYPRDLIPAYVAHLMAATDQDDPAAVAVAVAQLAIARSLGLVPGENGAPSPNGSASSDRSEVPVKAAATGVRAPCARCRHPRALHGGGEGIPCKASGCNKGPDGGPCPGYMALEPALVPEHASR